jgi:hypothetical protein
MQDGMRRHASEVQRAGADLNNHIDRQSGGTLEALTSGGLIRMRCRKTALNLFKAFDADVGIGDIAATISAARDLTGSTGKLGIVGYCLGGLMAFLTAARNGADARVRTGRTTTQDCANAANTRTLTKFYALLLSQAR